MDKLKNIVTLVSCLLLLGCQGQNPFKRQSNPVTDYEATRRAVSQPYVPPELNGGPGLGPISSGNKFIHVIFKGTPAKMMFAETYSFDIQISIDNATPNSTPSITPVPTTQQELLNSKVDPKDKALDASQAVDCGPTATPVNASTWKFSCVLVTNKIIGVEPMFKSGQISPAAFTIQINESGAPGAAPGRSPLVLPIEFPKIETKPPQQGSVPRSEINLATTGNPGVHV